MMCRTLEKQRENSGFPCFLSILFSRAPTSSGTFSNKDGTLTPTAKSNSRYNNCMLEWFELGTCTELSLNLERDYKDVNTDTFLVFVLLHGETYNLFLITKFKEEKAKP